MKSTALEILAKHTRPDGDCVVWTGSRNARGYGQCKHSGQWLAHRLAWVASKGPIPSGLCVCHRCDNPACVKIDHLFLGTNDDNVADRVAKGRSASRPGQTNGNCKLKGSLMELALRLIADGLPDTQVAKRCGVSSGAIWQLRVGRTHRDTTRAMTECSSDYERPRKPLALSPSLIRAKGGA